GRVDERGRTGGQGVRSRQAQGAIARAQEAAGEVCGYRKAPAVRADAAVGRGVRRPAEGQGHGRGGPHRRQRRQAQPVRRRVHAAPGRLARAVEARGPRLPRGRAATTGEPLPAGRRLLCPRRPPPRERRPLPRGRVDRRRHHRVQIVTEPEGTRGRGWSRVDGGLHPGV
ncbi:MAG: hypothetical protein AVDCRST_MAG22-2444, partial [uncultured Rubrobacteraceae bacterium]